MHQYGDVRYGVWRVGEQIKKELFSFEHLAVGRPAPNLAAKGLDGIPFELKDYRGKVTVVEFWADELPYCREMYPARRKMVDDSKGRP